MLFVVFILLMLSTRFSAIGSNGMEKILRIENLFRDIELLSTELLYRMHAGHCYTIVTDSLYQEILSAQLFREIERSVYFVVLVPFNEDMLTPNKQMNATLQEAKKSGCKCYLIYLANGIQMERFLRFIDHERAIDTQAELIILHDYRLFVPRSFYIWRRFINVVFIRQYEHTTNRNNHSKTISTFELATVPYPLPIKKIFVTKNLDFWRSGRFRRGGKLTSDKTRNLNGQPMRTVVLKHTPAVSIAIDSSNDTIYSGLEVEILRGISQSMNFTPVFYESDDAATEKWGTKTANGSYTGIIGEIVNGDTDIAIGDLAYTPYHLELMDLSIPYTSQCLTFLTPEALTDNSWKTLILPFSAATWASVLFFLFCVGALFYVLEHVNAWIHRNNSKGVLSHRSQPKGIVLNPSGKSFSQHKRIKRNKLQTKDIFDSFGDCILLTYSMLLVVSLPRLPRSWPIRLLTGWYWGYCISIVVAYRASLTAILANPAPRVTIDTLRELASSQIDCGVWGEQNKQFFVTSTDEIGQKISDKIVVVNDANEAINRVSLGKFAYYENKHFLREMRFIHDQIASNKQKSLHIMKECAINLPISLGLERNSPLKPRFDQLLRQIMESGLIGKWLRDSVQSFESSVESPPQEALMDLKKMYGVFVALAIGFSLAILVLIAELLYWNFVTKKSPLYDKYALVKLYQCNSRAIEHCHRTHHV